MIIPLSTAPPFNTAKGVTLSAFDYYLLCQGQSTMAPLGYSPLYGKTGVEQRLRTRIGFIQFEELAQQGHKFQLADLQTLVTEKYLRKIAADPITGSAETWQTVPSETDPSNPSAEPGISDVKSGSDQSGLNGKPYSE